MLKTFRTSLEHLNAAVDPHINDYFYLTETVGELLSFAAPPTFGVGLKGVGKTAAYRYLSETKKSGVITVGIDIDKYSLALPKSDIPYALCRKQFEHDLITEALRLCKDDSTVPPNLRRKAAAQVKGYVKALKATAGRFRGISILGCGFTLSDPTTRLLVGFRTQRELTDSLNLLSDICTSGVKILIVVDDPEFVFSASQVLDIHLVGGFLLAALSLTSKVANCRVVPLVKTHIYDPIQARIEDFDKYPNARTHLAWSKDELVRLVEERLNWSKCRWPQVFKGGKKEGVALLKAKLAPRLRNGPRDLLRALELALKASGGKPIKEEDLEVTSKQLSSYVLQAMGASYSESYPGLIEVIRDLFSDAVEEEYEREELSRKIVPYIESSKKSREIQSWLQEETARTLPELLFRVGALALRRDGVVLPYEKDYDLATFEASRVSLAPGLRSALKG